MLWVFVPLSSISILAGYYDTCTCYLHLPHQFQTHQEDQKFYQRYTIHRVRRTAWLWVTVGWWKTWPDSNQTIKLGATIPQAATSWPGWELPPQIHDDICQHLQRPSWSIPKCCSWAIPKYSKAYCRASGECVQLLRGWEHLLWSSRVQPAQSSCQKLSSCHSCYNTWEHLQGSSRVQPALARQSEAGVLHLDFTKYSLFYQP